MYPLKKSEHLLVNGKVLVDTVKDILACVKQQTRFLQNNLAVNQHPISPCQVCKESFEKLLSDKFIKYVIETKCSAIKDSQQQAICAQIAFGKAALEAWTASPCLAGCIRN